MRVDIRDTHVAAVTHLTIPTPHTAAAPGRIGAFQRFFDTNAPVAQDPPAPDTTPPAEDTPQVEGSDEAASSPANAPAGEARADETVPRADAADLPAPGEAQARGRPAPPDVEDRAAIAGRDFRPSPAPEASSVPPPERSHDGAVVLVPGAAPAAPAKPATPDVALPIAAPTLAAPSTPDRPERPGPDVPQIAPAASARNLLAPNPLADGGRLPERASAPAAAHPARKPPAEALARTFTPARTGTPTPDSPGASVLPVAPARGTAPGIHTMAWQAEPTRNAPAGTMDGDGLTAIRASDLRPDASGATVAAGQPGPSAALPAGAGSKVAATGPGLASPATKATTAPHQPLPPDLASPVRYRHQRAAIAPEGSAEATGDPEETAPPRPRLRGRMDASAGAVATPDGAAGLPDRPGSRPNPAVAKALHRTGTAMQPVPMARPAPRPDIGHEITPSAVSDPWQPTGAASRPGPAADRMMPTRLAATAQQARLRVQPEPAASAASLSEPSPPRFAIMSDLPQPGNPPPAEAPHGIRRRPAPHAAGESGQGFPARPMDSAPQPAAARLARVPAAIPEVARPATTGRSVATRAPDVAAETSRAPDDAATGPAAPAIRQGRRQHPDPAAPTTGPRTSDPLAEPRPSRNHAMTAALAPDVTPGPDMPVAGLTGLPAGRPQAAAADGIGPTIDIDAVAHPVHPGVDRPPPVALPEAPPAPRAVQVLQQIAPAMKVFPDGIAEVTLSPKELGHVRMAMQTDGDSLVVHIVADRREILDLLQRHTAQLSTALRDAGFADVQYAFSHGGRQSPQPRGDIAPQGDPAADLHDPAQAPAPPRLSGDRLDLRL